MAKNEVEQIRRLISDDESEGSMDERHCCLGAFKYGRRDTARSTLPNNPPTKRILPQSVDPTGFEWRREIMMRRKERNVCQVFDM